SPPAGPGSTRRSRRWDRAWQACPSSRMRWSTRTSSSACSPSSSTPGCSTRRRSRVTKPLRPRTAAAATRRGDATKVAFIGTHGVGKTTLCYDLAGGLKKRGIAVDMVKEVARLSPLPINRKTSLDAQTWILVTQIAEEIRSAAHHEVVVCDRSVLDNYAYLVFAAGRQKWLEPLVNRWMKSYDVLFKVPYVGGATADGIRDTDEFFMKQIDRL